ncbi:helix-turn-helix domain-containing protein [Alkalihalobacillus deserti]|uniref:helix-turn-helix domain-containing protein n=1 Tax=Alkalihalobacillus deserti TaxID=2879466 RepID=UPI001D14A9FC|nr:helix-turn-helix domain-containing protein [Alkalihalobacillus deserti]
MNGAIFGLYIKKLRNEKNISSRDLSSDVGKAITYVSQLERGLIKKPDFNTSYHLLLKLGVDKIEIKKQLEEYGILSEEREREKMKEYTQQITIEDVTSIRSDDDALSSTVPFTKEQLKKENDRIHACINNVITKDLNKAAKLLRKINRLINERID